MSSSSSVSVENGIKTPIDKTIPYHLTDRPVNTEIQQPQTDITVVCKMCEKRIKIRKLQEHRTYHNALLTLGYHENKKPPNVELLLRRRQHLIKKLSKYSNMITIQRINDAFEFVKSVMQGTYDNLREVTEPVVVDCVGQPLNCSASCIHAMSFCSDANERWKSKMEDTCIFQDFFGNDMNKCFFAVYDGHNGRFAADIVAYDFHHFLLNEMIRFDPKTTCRCTVNHAGKIEIEEYDRKPLQNIRKDSIRHILHEEGVNIIQQIMHTCDENIQHLKNIDRRIKRSKKKCVKNPFAEKMGLAFNRAYIHADDMLKFGVDEMSRVRWSGCSALTCVIESTSELDELTDVDSPPGMPQKKGVIYIANSGNVHAVLCRNGKAYKLTRDHTLNNANEINRVKKAGAEVHTSQKGARVNGILETTRGFGNHGDQELKKAVIVDPYTTSVTVDQYAEFLIIASNGLWEVLSEDEAVSIIYEMMPSAEMSCSLPDHLNKLTKSMKSTMQLFSSNNEQYTEKSDRNENHDKLATLENNIIDTCLEEDVGTDFGSLMSTLTTENDRIEADIATVTEMQMMYAQSHMYLSEEERYRDLSKNMSERLVEAALLAGSRDNITVMLILLPGCKI
ncbi:protein phosphatase 2C-like domain-containing protein 1 isoform X2 [Antedon mediterranea]